MRKAKDRKKNFFFLLGLFAVKSEHLYVVRVADLLLKSFIWIIDQITMKEIDNHEEIM